MCGKVLTKRKPPKKLIVKHQERLTAAGSKWMILRIDPGITLEQRDRLPCKSNKPHISLYTAEINEIRTAYLRELRGGGSPGGTDRQKRLTRPCVSTARWFGHLRNAGVAI